MHISHIRFCVQAYVIFPVLLLVTGCPKQQMKQQVVTAPPVTHSAPSTTFAASPQTIHQGTTAVTMRPSTSQPEAAVSVTPAPVQEKTIKDPAEFAAYKNATAIADSRQKADALLQFVSQYPNTVVKEEALEETLAAYQQSGNPEKLESTATQLLQTNPRNLRGLTVLTYLKLQAGKQAYGAGDTATATAPLREAAQYAENGLQTFQTASNDADMQKFKAVATPIFDEALGMNALNSKNYADAQKYLLAAVEALNANAPLEVVYELTSAYLQPVPPDAVRGSWFGARAVNLAQPSQQQSIRKYVLFYYKKYHGSSDGFDDLLNQTKTAALPPADFTVAPAPPAPSPAELARQALKNNRVEDLGFEDWLFILGSGFKEGEDEVWSYLRGKRTDIHGDVISATPSEIMIAVTNDDKAAHKADMTLKLRKPLPPGRVPRVGSVVDYDVTFASYTTNPLMVTANDATVHGVRTTATTR